jgi:DNA-binding NtrC family response regulator
VTGSTVLVVDDDDGVRLGIRGFLEAHGYRVEEAESWGRAPPEPLPAEGSLNLQEMEVRAIEAALRIEHGRVEDAARRLGISRSALYLKIKKLGLKPSRT